eukprot:UN10587
MRKNSRSGSRGRPKISSRSRSRTNCRGNFQTTQSLAQARNDYSTENIKVHKEPSIVDTLMKQIADMKSEFKEQRANEDSVLKELSSLGQIVNTSSKLKQTRL